MCAVEFVCDEAGVYGDGLVWFVGSVLIVCDRAWFLSDLVVADVVVIVDGIEFVRWFAATVVFG